MLRRVLAKRLEAEHTLLEQVRVDAVAALRNLVDAFHEDDLPSIQPLIPNLLNQLFALMNEVRSRALIPAASDCSNN